jgi:thiazole synthase
MPLGSPIGSGQGIINLEAIRIIIAQAERAGSGRTPESARLRMRLSPWSKGRTPCLVNTAVALAGNPAMMAAAIAGGVSAGRQSYLSGRIPRLPYASASSPLSNVVGSAST